MLSPSIAQPPGSSAANAGVSAAQTDFTQLINDLKVGKSVASQVITHLETKELTAAELVLFCNLRHTSRLEVMMGLDRAVARLNVIAMRNRVGFYRALDEESGSGYRFRVACGQREVRRLQDLILLLSTQPALQVHSVVARETFGEDEVSYNLRERAKLYLYDGEDFSPYSAKALFEQAIERGSTEAMVDLAILSAEQKFFGHHVTRPKLLYQRAIELGNIRAKVEAAIFYQENRRSIKGAAHMAITLLDEVRHMENVDPELKRKAVIERAIMYQYGWGSAVSYIQAITLFHSVRDNEGMSHILSSALLNEILALPDEQRLVTCWEVLVGKSTSPLAYFFRLRTQGREPSFHEKGSFQELYFQVCKLNASLAKQYAAVTHTLSRGCNNATELEKMYSVLCHDSQLTPDQKRDLQNYQYNNGPTIQEMLSGVTKQQEVAVAAVTVEPVNAFELSRSGQGIFGALKAKWSQALETLNATIDYSSDEEEAFELEDMKQVSGPPGSP